MADQERRRRSSWSAIEVEREREKERENRSNASTDLRSDSAAMPSSLPRPIHLPHLRVLGSQKSTFHFHVFVSQIWLCILEFQDWMATIDCDYAQLIALPIRFRIFAIIVLGLRVLAVTLHKIIPKLVEWLEISKFETSNSSGILQDEFKNCNLLNVWKGSALE